MANIEQWEIQTLHPAARVGVIADQETIAGLAVHPLLRTLIPGDVRVGLPTGPDNYKFVLTINHAQDKKLWTFDGKIGSLTDRMRPKMPSYVIVLIWQFLDAVLQHLGVFTIHASGVELRDRGRCVLFLGPEGIGKTALAISAADAGHAIIGNNRIAIQNGAIIGGTLMASIRPADIYRYADASWFSSIVRPTGSSWAFVDLEAVGLSATSGARRTVQTIVLPRISQNRVYETSAGDASQIIVETFGAASRSIKGDCLVFGPTSQKAQPAPSLDTNDLAKQRLGQIQWLVLNTPTLEAVGEIHDILSSCLPNQGGEFNAQG